MINHEEVDPAPGAFWGTSAATTVRRTDPGAVQRSAWYSSCDYQSTAFYESNLLLYQNILHTPSQKDAGPTCWISEQIYAASKDPARNMGIGLRPFGNSSQGKITERFRREDDRRYTAGQLRRDYRARLILRQISPILIKTLLASVMPHESQLYASRLYVILDRRESRAGRDVARVCASDRSTIHPCPLTA